MYKYLPITSNISEMFVSVGSLPICTIVFDSKIDLVDMNQLASNFLQIKNKEDYLSGKYKIKIDYPYLEKIISKLKRGITIFEEIMRIECVDGSSVNIMFNASMICGKQRFFLFQFVDKLSIFDSQEHVNSQKKRQRSVQSSSKKVNQRVLCSNTESVFEDIDFQPKIVTQLFERHVNLTKDEVVLCSWIMKNKSVVEIAEISRKTRNHIYGNVRQIVRKLELKSTRELYRYLNEFSA